MSILIIIICNCTKKKVIDALCRLFIAMFDKLLEVFMGNRIKLCRCGFRFKPDRKLIHFSFELAVAHAILTLLFT